jgi:hypothetical protein
MKMRLTISAVLAALLCSTSVFAEEGKEPTAEAKQAAKSAKESAGNFDPQGYLCNQFMGDLESESAMAGIALIWMHGYQSAVYGTDEIGPLNEDSIAALAQEAAEYCAESGDETFSRMAHYITSEE